MKPETKVFRLQYIAISRADGNKPSGLSFAELMRQLKGE